MAKTGLNVGEFLKGFAAIAAAKQQAQYDNQAEAFQQRQQGLQAAMAAFPQMARMEDDRWADELAPFETALKTSDPNAPGYDALLQQFIQKQGSRPQRQFGPERFGQMFQQLYPGVKMPWVGGDRHTGAGPQPMNGPLPGMGVPSAPGGVPVPVRDMSAADRASLTKLLAKRSADAYQVDPVVAGQIDAILGDLEGQRITPQQARELMRPIDATVRTKFQEQQDLAKKRLKQQDEESDQNRKIREAQLEVEKEKARSIADDRVRTDLIAQDSARAKALSDAIKSGNVSRIIGAAKDRYAHWRANEKHLGPVADTSLDPTPQPVKRKGPSYLGVKPEAFGGFVKTGPQEVGPVTEYDDVETQAEADARVMRNAIAYAEDPKAKQKLQGTLVTQLFKLLGDKRLDVTSKNDVLEEIAAYAKDPNSKVEIPTGLKFKELDPYQEKRLAQIEAAFTLRKAEAARRAEAHRLAVQYKRKQITKIEQDIAAGGKGKAAKWDEGFKAELTLEKAELTQRYQEYHAAVEDGDDEIIDATKAAVDEQLAKVRAMIGGEPVNQRPGMGDLRVMEQQQSTRPRTPREKRDEFIAGLMAGGMTRQEAEREANRNQVRIRSAK